MLGKFNENRRENRESPPILRELKMVDRFCLNISATFN